jgi:alkyl sulfatase BDS1-like metallo-beta-lactamase superfamily hydrolase
MTSSSHGASSTIRDQHTAALAALPFSDAQDFEDANRGLIAPLDGPVLAPDGTVLWDNSTYDFLGGEAPDTVNPSLWRQSQLCAIDGLFEVSEGIYQVRGMDLEHHPRRGPRRRDRHRHAAVGRDRRGCAGAVPQASR